MNAARSVRYAASGSTAARWVLVCLAALAAACGADRWRELDARLHAAAAPARREGFEPLSGPYNQFGTFQGDFAQAWKVALDSGVFYQIGTVCSDGCLRIAAAVEGAGPSTWLRFTAPRRDTFTVDLAGRCATNTRCWWIAQVYARGVAGMRPGFAGGER